MVLKRIRKSSLYFLFGLVLVITMITKISCEVSLLKYYEAQHALAHVIKSVKSNQLEQVDDTYEQQCTNSNDCCICKKNFRNATYLELHMQIHHSIKQRKPEDTLLTQIFDKKINSQYRFETCLKIFDFIDVKNILQRDRQVWSVNKEEQLKISTKYLAQNIALNKTQIVDICTVIAFGAYHQPLWIIWIKGTLIFIFAIVFLVYFANLFDEINQYYFPKKSKKNRLKSNMTESN